MKFSGKIGFWEGDVETKPGVFKPKIVEKPYTGDITRYFRKFQTVENQQNKDLTVNNQISIISDLYLRNNWHMIKYVLWNGVKWEVNTIDVLNFPRVILEIGGLYHEETTA